MERHDFRPVAPKAAREPRHVSFYLHAVVPIVLLSLMAFLFQFLVI
jgi:hypothetical protein